VSEPGNRGFIDSYGAYTPDGIHRYNVRCRATVYSHVVRHDVPETNGQYELFGDLISCETSKSIRGGGGANFTLVPRRNYMNLIYPNDYVNIYFDPGDGRGWIRTFFGLVDRVTRSINTDQNGATTTRFQVICSDLTKVMDHLSLYYNPDLVPGGQRPDIAKEFTQNIVGLNMLMSGVVISGTPADILMGLMMVFLGWGTQFRLPPSLAAKAGETIKKNRQARLAWARGRLPDVVKDALEATGTKTLSELQNLMDVEARKNATERNAGRPPSRSQINEARVDLLRGMQGLNKNTPREVVAAIYGEQFTMLNQRIEASVALPWASVLDLIDFRHVEWRAMDGSVTSASISQQEGSLWSVMNSYSNGEINELFVDLRPMQEEPTPGGSGAGLRQDVEVSEASYARALDSVSGNSLSSDQDPPGVRYEPCVIMREYPFGTVQDFNPPPTVLKNEGIALQKIVFGAIFSKGAGSTGRKVVQIPALNPYLMDKNPPEQAIKSLDTITISVKDIVNESVGRSDQDHTNWIEIYNDLTGGGQVQIFQSLCRYIIPVTNAVGVARHGLRNRRIQSRYNRFSKNIGEPTSFTYIPTINASIRWALMLDHWYQHNTEYLTGTMTIRGLPELRVGYRLDVEERNESYYVENVSHRWAYPNMALLTTIQVTRGQRNDPFPVYVYPSSPGFFGIREPGKDGRLERFFDQKNPSATTASQYLDRQRRDWGLQPYAEDNTIDEIDSVLNPWSGDTRGYECAGASVMLKEMIDELEYLGRFKTPSEQAAWEAAQGAGVLGIFKPPGQ